MDDVAEQHELANEISDAISNPVGFNTDLDEVRQTLIFVIPFSIISYFRPPSPLSVCKVSAIHTLSLIWKA